MASQHVKGGQQQHQVEHSHVVGHVNHTTTLENTLAVSLKTEHTHPLWPSHSNHRYLTKRTKNICLWKKHPRMPINFLLNSQNLETAQVFINRIQKLHYVHITNACWALRRINDWYHLNHRWQTQGLWAESSPPPCFIRPSTLFLPGGSAELSLNC